MEADIAVSDVVQFMYCPRKVYFYKVLGLPMVDRKKMTYGKDEHEREHRRVKERKHVYGIEKDQIKKVQHGVFIVDEDIGLYGQIDTVVELQDGSVIPVDVKYSDYSGVFKNWKKQLLAYALLLERKSGVKVRKGLLYFPKQRKKVFVELSAEDKEFFLKDIERIRGMIKSGKMPRGRDRCGYCEMKKYCKE
ncbi:MAG: CRISPR-associated protein Cas4 [Candidatus Methanofastidiosia archaeon]